MAPCAFTALQSSENFERPSHLPNYTHNHPLCPSILYPNTSDPTTNVSDHTGQVRIHTGQVRILPDKFGSYRLSVRRPLTPGAESLHQKGGNVLLTFSLFQKINQVLEQSCERGWDLHSVGWTYSTVYCTLYRLV